jgi:hypothetical protein
MNLSDIDYANVRDASPFPEIRTVSADGEPRTYPAVVIVWTVNRVNRGLHSQTIECQDFGVARDLAVAIKREVCKARHAPVSLN